MQAWLGLSTKDNYRNGCMQDIHWTDGGFGYFPSYTLGACTPQLFHAAKTALPGLQASIADGDFSALLTGCARTSGSTAAASAPRNYPGDR
jgi:carboxypeptidase Taq